MRIQQLIQASAGAQLGRSAVHELMLQPREHCRLDVEQGSHSTPHPEMTAAMNAACTCCSQRRTQGSQVMPATAQAIWSSSLYIFSLLTPTAPVSSSCTIAPRSARRRVSLLSALKASFVKPQLVHTVTSGLCTAVIERTQGQCESDGQISACVDVCSS